MPPRWRQLLNKRSGLHRLTLGSVFGNAYRRRSARVDAAQRSAEQVLGGGAGALRVLPVPEKVCTA